MSRVTAGRGVVTLIVMGTILALTLAGCTSEEDRFEDHHARAEQYARDGQNKQALLELRSALKLRPQDAATCYQIAGILRLEGQLEDAVFFLREAYRLDPENVEAGMELAGLLLGSEPEEAEELIDDAYQRFPDECIVHSRRSELALVRVDTDAALAAALTAVELCPEDPRFHINLGIVHEARLRELRLQGERPPDAVFEAAIAAFDAANSLEGSRRVTDTVAVMERARVLSIWPGHEEEAKAAYREALDKEGKASTRPRARETRAAMATAALEYARRIEDSGFQRWVLEKLVEIDPARIPAWLELSAVVEAQEGRGAEIVEQMLAANPEDADAHLAYAGRLERAGRLEEALAHLEKAAKDGIDPARLETTIIRRQLSLGQRDEARARIEALQQAYPDHADVALPIAELALAEGRAADAARALRERLEGGESADAWRLLATAEFRLGNASEASAAVDRALELGPRPAGTALLRLKMRIAEAAEDWSGVFQTMRRLNRTTGEPPNRQERLMLARALYGLERADRGRAVLLKLLEEDDPPLLASVAFARREGRRSPQQAYDFIGEALERAPGNSMLLEQRMALADALGRNAEALAELEAAIDRGPVTPVHLFLRSRANYLKKDYDRAEQDALRAFEAAPNLRGIVALLASIYRDQGRVDEAIRSFEQAEEAGVLPPSGQVLLGRLLLEQGKMERALIAYDKALKQNPDMAAAANDLAYLLAKQNIQLDRALALAQQAQKAMGTSASVADTLGYVYYRRNLPDAAIEQIRYAIELAEKAGSPQAAYHYHLGLALGAKGNPKAAVAAYEKALAIDADFSEAAELKSELEAARAALDTGTGAGPS